MKAISRQFLRAVVLFSCLPSSPAAQPVPEAAYQGAKEYLASYLREHGDLEHAALGQPYTVLISTYGDVSAARDASELLSTARVYQYDFPIWVDGELERVIMVLTDFETGEVPVDGGRGEHTASPANSVVWRLSQEVRPRELFRFFVNWCAADFIVAIDESGDTLITPSNAHGARVLSMKPSGAGEYPLMSLSESLPSLRAYAEELRVKTERWRK